MISIVNFLKKSFLVLFSIIIIYILALINIIIIIAILTKFNISVKPGGIPYASLSFVIAGVEFFLLYKLFKWLRDRGKINSLQS